MVAPRALACSISSSTSTPPPSPSTKPSRSRSNGRLARVGSSLRVDIAVSRMNPVMASGWIMLWVPPASITSASPWRISSDASPIAWALAAHAVWQVALGPRAPKMAARCPTGPPGSCSASRVGWSDWRPRLVNRAVSTRPSRLERLDHVDERVEVLLSVSRAEVDPEAGARDPAVLQSLNTAMSAAAAARASCDVRLWLRPPGLVGADSRTGVNPTLSPRRFAWQRWPR